MAKNNMDLISAIREEIKMAVKETLIEMGVTPSTKQINTRKEDELLNMKEALIFCRCSRSTFFNYLKLGLIKRTRIKGNGKLLFKKADLLKLIDQDNNQNKK